jgi:hypothetical protein
MEFVPELQQKKKKQQHIFAKLDLPTEKVERVEAIQTLWIL